MRAIGLRSLSIATLALVFAGAAAAQTPSSAILNAAEVQLLVTRAEPDDHVRLGAHFDALAARSTEDAKRHKAMGFAYAGNAGRTLSANHTAHCDRLAELATQSAATLRELSSYHHVLAIGGAARAPKNSSPFESGQGARAPQDKELRRLAAQARTPADHRALEEYYLTLAKGYGHDAADHVAMASAYRGNANRRGGDPAVHCDRMVTLSRDAAKEATAAAAMHKDLAGRAR